MLPALRPSGRQSQLSNHAFAPIREAVSNEVLSMVTGGLLLFLLSAVIGIACRPREDDPPPPLLVGLVRGAVRERTG
ncbi:MAG: hypothetical protein HZB13_16690 [Acidobacteria bacterium]|nr:hypothetical protein [Acidobacteriota bacterium]